VAASLRPAAMQRARIGSRTTVIELNGRIVVPCVIDGLRGADVRRRSGCAP